MTDVLTHLEIIQEGVLCTHSLSSNNEREVALVSQFLTGSNFQHTKSQEENVYTDFRYALSWHHFIPLALVTSNIFLDNQNNNNNNNYSSSHINVDCTNTNKILNSSHNVENKHLLPIAISKHFNKIFTVNFEESNVMYHDGNNFIRRKYKKESTLCEIDTKFTEYTSFISCLDGINRWIEILYKNEHLRKHVNSSNNNYSNSNSNNNKSNCSSHCLIVIQFTSSHVGVNDAVTISNKCTNSNNNNNNIGNVPLSALLLSNDSKRNRTDDNDLHTFLHDLACVSNLCTARYEWHKCNFAVMCVLEQHHHYYGLEIMCKSLQTEFAYKYVIKFFNQRESSNVYSTWTDYSCNEENNNNNNNNNTAITNTTNNSEKNESAQCVFYREMISVWDPQLLLTEIKICNNANNNNNTNNSSNAFSMISSNVSQRCKLELSIMQLVRQSSALYFLRPRNWTFAHFLMKSLQNYPVLLTIAQLKQCQSIWSLRHNLHDVTRTFHIMLTNYYETAHSSTYTETKINTTTSNSKEHDNKNKRVWQRHNSLMARYEDSIKLIDMLLETSLHLADQALERVTSSTANFVRSMWPSENILQSIFFMLLYNELVSYSSSSSSLSSSSYSCSDSSLLPHHKQHHELLRFSSIVNELANMYDYHSESYKVHKQKHKAEEHLAKKLKDKAIMALYYLLPFANTNVDNNFSNLVCNTAQNYVMTHNIVQIPHLLLPPDLKISLARQLQRTLLTKLIPPQASLSELKRNELKLMSSCVCCCTTQGSECNLDNMANNNLQANDLHSVAQVKSPSNFYSPSVPMFVRVLYVLAMHSMANRVTSERSKYMSLVKVAAVCLLHGNRNGDSNDDNDDDDDDDLHLLRVLHELQTCGFVALMRDKNSGEVMIRSLLH